MEDVGGRLRELKQARRWTVDEMAQACGLSKSTVEKLLDGTLNPSFKSIFGICKGFSVSSDWLLFGQEGRFSVAEHEVFSITRRAAFSQILELPHSAKEDGIDPVLGKADPRARAYEQATIIAAKVLDDCTGVSSGCFSIETGPAAPMKGT